MPIKFSDVSFTYSLKTPFANEALTDINLSIKDKLFTCIVGKTGCGKSTLIQQLNGLLIPTEGEVIVDEYVITRNRKRRSKKLSNLRKKVGIVFQFSENQLFEESVLDDVAFGPTNFKVSKEDARKIAKECLLKVGIKEEYFNKSPFELSGGEKRRVAIAGVLALSPSIIVLDEPTAGLDPKGTKEMMDLLKKMNNDGATVIVVTHDMNLVFTYADEVVVISSGKIAKQCSPSELFLVDDEQYSLETPNIAKVVQLFHLKGIDLDTNKIKDVTSLASEIVKKRNKNE